MQKSTRTERIGLLARETQGRKDKPAFLASLSQAIGLTILPDQLLNLESTDQVLTDFRAGYALALAGELPAGRIFFTREERLIALRSPKLFANSLAEERAFLWLKQSSSCGAVVLTTSQVLHACEQVRVLDGDTVSLLSEDHTQGFM